MKYKPVGYFLMLRSEGAEEFSKGGIYIPEQARNNLNEGVVIDKGELVEGYAVGDKVVFNNHSEYRLRIDGEEIVLVSTENILLHKKGDITVAPVQDPVQDVLLKLAASQ